MKKRYENMDGVTAEKSFRDFLKWRKERTRQKRGASCRLEVETSPSLHYLKNNGRETTITWIGHSTFLIQVNGLSILTDPVWAKFMGVSRRQTPPAISLQDLPPIDVVLISHNHYDHLHFSSLRRLPGNFLLLVPAGLKRKMVRKGFSRVEELEWWEQFQVGDVSFHFVPAQHWSKRTLRDTNTSHWGGFVIEGKHLIYFAGDSGYFRGFREIGQRFAHIDYALMPIGAYAPEWFLSTQHVNPEQAVQAYLDVGARYFVPMHYGAYCLGDETPEEALERLRLEWRRRGLDEAVLCVPKPGQTLQADGDLHHVSAERLPAREQSISGKAPANVCLTQEYKS